MNELISVGILLTAIVGGLLAFAPRLSEWLVTVSARRLPQTLSERMREEWLAELGALPGRVSQLAFAIALTRTRRHSFAIDGESPFAPPARSPITLATFGGWPSVVVFTTLVVAAIAYGASFLIQPLYQSRIVLAVVPPQIPARFIEAAPSISVDERQRAFSETVFSRGNLEKAIVAFDLYKSERRGRPDEQDTLAAVERMRSDISVEVQDGGVGIAYTSPNPHTAMIVTEHLAALALRANYERRHDTSRSTLEVLKVQIQDVKLRLLKSVTNTENSASSDADANVRALKHESLKTTYRDLLLKREKARVALVRHSRVRPPSAARPSPIPPIHTAALTRRL